jgi:hypothetical protein
VKRSTALHTLIVVGVLTTSIWPVYTVTAAGITFQTVPFNAESERLSPGFAGHDVYSIIAAAGKLKNVAPKGEFETTAQYEARLESAKRERLVGTTTLEDMLGIVLPAEEAKSKYDADRSALAIYFRATSWYGDGTSVRNLPDAALLREEHKNTGTYTGANAFNRKVLVQKATRRSTYVIFGTSGRMPCAGTTLELDPARAKELKSTLRVVLIGTLTPNYVERRSTVAAATIDSPLELKIEDVGLKIDLSAVWFINQRTGEVLARTALNKRMEFINLYATPAEMECR